MISLPLRIITWMISGYLLGNGVSGIQYYPDSNTFVFFDAISIHMTQLEMLLSGGVTAIGAFAWRAVAKRLGKKL